MFYVASVRKPGHLKADAKIFSSREDASKYIEDNASEEDFTHISEHESWNAADNEYSYQRGTVFQQKQ